MWYRFNAGRVQNLVTGVELRVREQGNLWQVVCESTATNPPTTVLATGFTTEENASNALNSFLSENNVQIAQPIPTSSISSQGEEK